MQTIKLVKLRIQEVKIKSSDRVHEKKNEIEIICAWFRSEVLTSEVFLINHSMVHGSKLWCITCESVTVYLRKSLLYSMITVRWFLTFLASSLFMLWKLNTIDVFSPVTSLILKIKCLPVKRRCLSSL